MSQIKKKLAMLLTVLMLVSTTFVISVAAPIPNPGTSDMYFRAEGAVELGNVYILPYDHDSYYDMGFQTVFYIDDRGLTSLKPTFWTAPSVNVFSGHNGAAGMKQESGVTDVDISKGPVQYTAVAENGAVLKNYWVTFVQKYFGGAKLFVNGVNGADGAKREVFLTSIHSNVHDISIANVGDDLLTGLTVTLTDAQHIKLDPYWTDDPAKNSNLAAFNGELVNFAKIRLLPDGEGEISGTLTISADRQEPVEITLTGYSGDPKLTTISLPEAVKNVPYAAQIHHNNQYSWNSVTLDIVSGTLPAGVTIMPNGELSGVPRETGTFTFEVQMINSDRRFENSRATYTLKVNENTNTTVDEPTYSGYEVGNTANLRLTTIAIPKAVKYVPYAVQMLQNNEYSWNHVTLSIVSGKLPAGVMLKANGELYGVPRETGTFTFEIRMTNSDRQFENSSATYTLEVNENTNFNVDNSTDSGYEVTKRVGTRVCCNDVIKAIAEHEFITEGEIGEFIGFWLNGVRLTENTDYTKEPGSTKITIKSQTFQNKANQSGTNTIAAEFRVDGDENKELKRAAQNFKMDVSKGSGSGTGSSSGSGSGSGTGSGSGSSTPGTSTPTPTPTPIPKPIPAPQKIITAPKPIVETIKVPVENGTAAIDVSSKAIADALVNAVEKKKKSSENPPIVIELVVTGVKPGVNDVNVSIPVTVIKEIAKVENASLKVNAGDLGTVTLNNTSLNSIAAEGGKTVGIYICREGNIVTVCVTVDDVPLAKIKGGVHVALPSLPDGEVIVVVNTNDAEGIVKKSVVEGGDVYALIDGSGTVQVINNSKTFSDVTSNDWYNNAILFVNSRELFVGVSQTKFAPNLPMTRAMLATVLYRLENDENIGAGNVFTDVLSGQWYSDGISWASLAGIVSGIGNGFFGVNDNITREQLAVFMYRYANYLGMDTIERGNTQRFLDAGETSPWANDAVRWAVGIGLMQGDGTYLNPKGEALRAQVAAIVMRFIDFLVK